MKKIRSFPKYYKIQQRRLRRFLAAVERKHPRIYFARKLRKDRKKVLNELNYAEITAPPNFSLVNHPDDLIDFLEHLRVLVFQRNNVVIDLSKIVDVTNDALIAMLAVINDQKSKKHLNVTVYKPNDTNVQERFMESGISEQIPSLQGLTPPNLGRIRQINGLRADLKKANELIGFATRKIFGQKRSLKDVQRVFSECIDNTAGHANPEKQLSEMWWATVFCDLKKGVAYFSLLDNGIGIFESLKMQWPKELGLFVKYRTNTALLKAIFEGEVLSRTGLSNRGNGLPGIYKARARNQIRRLVVITNNVFADFDKGEYRKLNRSFRGTFYYWEVHNENNDQGKQN
jgi:hypothetical protein